jgi:hypothetical protein
MYPPSSSCFGFRPHSAVDSFERPKKIEKSEASRGDAIFNTLYENVEFSFLLYSFGFVAQIV